MVEWSKTAANCYLSLTSSQVQTWLWASEKVASDSVLSRALQFLSVMLKHMLPLTVSPPGGCYL